MIKKIGLLLAGAMGLYALEACVLVQVDCTKDPTNAACTDNSGGAGVGGGGGDGTGGTGGIGTGGTGGTGGAPVVCSNCCSDIVIDAAQELCMTASQGSQDTYKALVDCSCGMGGKCEPVCGTNRCAGMPSSKECNDCLTNQVDGCGSEVNTCAGDNDPTICNK